MDSMDHILRFILWLKIFILNWKISLCSFPIQEIKKKYYYIKYNAKDGTL